MLSVRRFFFTITQYSSILTCNKTLTHYTLRRAGNEIIDRSYSRSVPQKLLIDEGDIQKYKIDPRVKAVANKLLYSDYIERKNLRRGYKINKMIIRRLVNKVKTRKHNELMLEPAMSVALKYLRENNEEMSEKMSDSEANEEYLKNEEYEEELEDVKPIHMPYASTDRYETFEHTDDDSVIKISDLNEKYKDLYEKYLAAKETEDEENFENFIDDKKSSDETQIDNEIVKMNQISPDWMNDYEQYDDNNLEDNSWKSSYGTPNSHIPISSIPCGGCGALLHCQDPAIPGYLPSELFQNQTNTILRSSVCQRCHFIKNYNTALDVKVSPDEYPALLAHIKKKKVAVILIIDLTDFPCSIWPGLVNIIGKSTQVFVVGNKVDLLPNDGPRFLENVENSLIKSLNEMGMGNFNIKSVNLISAKTGFGVERLINKLHKFWEYKGDVYLIGCTNVGKSSLFNALLGSDYCKVQAADIVQRATISHWPGTTLNLLKFPILNPVRWRLWMRMQRLMAERAVVTDESEYRNELLKQTKKIRYATLQGHIGQTFADSMKTEGHGFFGENEAANLTGYLGLNENNEIYQSSRWCFDTPGTIHPDSVLHLLTTEELMLTLSRDIIAPRTFQIRRSQTLFIAGLGRLDFIKGCDYIRCTVFASKDLPVTICSTHYAHSLYEELLLSDAFVVPKNDPERLKVFPVLKSKDLEIKGTDMRVSSADVVLSSAGWISLTVGSGRKAKIRVWTPEGRGIHLRTPAMLSRSVKLCGTKVSDSPAHRGGKQVYSKK